MSDYEKDCYTCKHLKKDDHEEPCRSCFAWDKWEKLSPDAQNSIKDWERRLFDV